MTTYAVIDFETTGLSPDQGARPTEIAVVLVSNGKFVGRYQSLMNPEVSIPYDIQALTGITNVMVKKAPKVSVVMREAADFVGDIPLLAHNAAFDKKFWNGELQKIQREPRLDFACSVMLSRRIFPDLSSYSLGALVKTLGLPNTGTFHRALADAEATAFLLIRLQQELMHRFKLGSVDHDLLLAIQNKSKHQLASVVLDNKKVKP